MKNSSISAGVICTILVASCLDAPTVAQRNPETAIYTFAHQCVVVGRPATGEVEATWVRTEDDTYAFAATSAADAERFFLKPSDLGTYLLYDTAGEYLVSDDGPLLRKETLESDMTLVDDDFVSEAEWLLEISSHDAQHYQLRHRRTGSYLGVDRLVEDESEAAVLTLDPAEGCREHPEMSLDATGSVEPRTYPDGSLFGFADTHSHILASFGFGGGGVMHGAAFHRLGVEHAMSDCSLFHAEEGRADFLGWGFGEGGNPDLDERALIDLLITGRLPERAHATDGWPTFSEWPSQTSATHQTQYYRQLERAWMSGLRLVVQHAVSNEAFCDLMVSTGFQPGRWSCEDMPNIDRQLEEVRRMERYIDAQAGGPDLGWFRVVETPAEAREVIAAGKMAVVLGIEVPNLFECYLTRRPGGPECDDEHIESQLDFYHDLGVRVLFPNHKFDNAFTPGDGHKGLVELGNFLTTAHWSNYVEDCPPGDTVFDRGSVMFGGFNKPRDEYLSPAPNPLIQFSSEPLRDLLPYIGEVREPPLEGDWCQKPGLTDAGVTLIEGMMARGMLIEIDHLPRQSYLDVFEMLVEADYPAVGTHGLHNDGKLYEIGGMSKTGFARCADPSQPGSMASRLRARRDLIVAAGGYPAEGFGFDLNGLAGVPNPRFGPDANCEQMQENPVEYPFESYAGDVTFTAPTMGERVIDFNNEGMIHIGLVPELIEDARRTGVTDEDLDIVFRSAEGYVRMWERAERRARALDPDRD